MPTFANRVSTFGTTIFTEINNLALEHEAINLGQGKPDFDGPYEIVKAAIDALQDGQSNQYPPGLGVKKLRQGIADHASRFYNLDVDVDKGVVVTSGATEGIFSSILGLVDKDDEVIIVEPYFDSYVPNVIMANAKPVFVSLHPPSWTFDEVELRQAFNEKTRAILLNTPNNPTGRVFTHEELTLIADLCKEHDVLVISDEVYEHLVFEGHQHIPIATLPDMFERTVTVGSAGKTFGMTGWKIGWVYGHPSLIQGVWQAHQYVTFATNHPAQRAVAYAFTMGNSYYEEYRDLYTKKRDLMMQAIESAGMKANQPEGTYFVMADFSDVYDDGNDVDFTKFLIREVGVACIPPSVFFSPEHRHRIGSHVRFSFCKDDDTLQEAGERMAKLRG